jgi:hypothetical protein
MKTKIKKRAQKSTSIDAVKMMREIREKLTQEIMGMTYKQEKAYLKRLLAKG